MLRSTFLPAALILASLSQPAAAQMPPAVTVYKSPTCGCCAKWVEHVRKAGFAVTVKDVPNVGEVKSANGVPVDLASCHTALVGGYVVEGHVPADVMQKLLKEKPAVAGIAVAGMPVGSPGMEGSHSERYDVVAFEKGGKQRVFASR
jgi:hypothetical protein